MGTDTRTVFEGSVDSDGVYFQSRPWEKPRKRFSIASVIIILLLLLTFPFQQDIPSWVWGLIVVALVGVALKYFSRGRRGAQDSSKPGAFFKIFRDRFQFMPENISVRFEDIKEIVISSLSPGWSGYRVSPRVAVVNFKLSDNRLFSYSWFPHSPKSSAQQSQKEVELPAFLGTLGFQITNQKSFPETFYLRFHNPKTNV